MIIEARIPFSQHTADVVIDPFDILCELTCDWRESIGVPRNSPIMGGYWMKSEDSEYGPYTRIRLATREEIVLFDAMKRITEYTATLSQ